MVPILCDLYDSILDSLCVILSCLDALMISDVFSAHFQYFPDKHHRLEA